MPSHHPPAHPTYILRGHNSAIHALNFLASNRYLLSGDADGWLVLWDTTSKRAAAVWRAHEAGVMGVGEWKPEGKGNDCGNGRQEMKAAGEIRILSHGRDHKLRVWQLRESDMEGLDKRLPADRTGDAESSTTHGREPWLLHVLDASALNFCAFAMCEDQDQDQDQGVFASPSTNGLSGSNANASDRLPFEAPQQADLTPTTTATPSTGTSSSSPPNIPAHKPILLATPNALSSGAIDIFALPSSRRVSTIPTLGPSLVKETGMLMAVGIAFIPTSPLDSAFGSSSQDIDAGADPSSQQALTVVAGYESGHVAVHVRQPPSPQFPQSQLAPGSIALSSLTPNSNTNTNTPLPQSQPHPQPWVWTTTYLTNPHTQPVLSLSLSLPPLPHPSPSALSPSNPPPSSSSFFITSAADAILASHPIPIPAQLLIPTQHQQQQHQQRPNVQVQRTPIQILKTGHSGQQSLTLRSDGRLCATAGWDGRVRVYAAGAGTGAGTEDGREWEKETAKGEDDEENATGQGMEKGKTKTKTKSMTMKELAVLKWHRQACYAVAFADVIPHSSSPSTPNPFPNPNINPPLATSTSASAPASDAATPIPQTHANNSALKPNAAPLLSTNTVTSTSRREGTAPLSLIRATRTNQARTTHWIAAGAKEGRVSLWVVY